MLVPTIYCNFLATQRFVITGFAEHWLTLWKSKSWLLLKSFWNYTTRIVMRVELFSNDDTTKEQIRIWLWSGQEASMRRVWMTSFRGKMICLRRKRLHSWLDLLSWNFSVLPFYNEICCDYFRIWSRILQVKKKSKREQRRFSIERKILTTFSQLDQLDSIVRRKIWTLAKIQ